MADELYHLPSGGRIRAAGIYPAVVAGVTGGFVLSLWLATQWIAWRWRFAPGLGTPWLIVSGQWAWAAEIAGLVGLVVTAALLCTRQRQWTVPVGCTALYLLTLSRWPLYAP